MQRTILSVALGLIFNISASSAWALNLGKGVLGSTLGQPLSFSVPVNSEPEEGITPECVTADVFSGDNKLAPGAVKISTDGAVGATQFTVRVTTYSPIDEPVVTVAVALGCPVRVTRRFVLFVDPPLVTSNAEVAPDEGFKRPGSDSLLVPPKPSNRSPGQAARGGPRAAAATRPAPRSDAYAAPVRPKRRITAAVPVPEGNAASKPALQRPPAMAKAAGPSASAPRLKLDSAPRVQTPPAPAASAAAAALLADALAANAAASAAVNASAASTALQETELRAARRVAALEESLAKLKAEAQASRKSMEALQASVRQADVGKNLPVLVWALGALAAVLAAAVAVLLWLQSRRRRNPTWWTGGLPEPQPVGDGRSVSPETRASRMPAEGTEPRFNASPVSASLRDSFTVASGPAPLSVGATSVAGVTAVSALASSFGASGSAVGVPSKAKSADNLASVGPSRELSVEELIDLEQQADFFVVLGQEEAAIDLLMTHVRSTGGLSPMPYMKLLDIYRRLGNHDAYERIRDRFKQRFNAEVPSSAVDPDQGRSITDYPDTLGELIAVWPNSFKAVETLGRWLSRGDDEAVAGSLAFDLPAYGELLFLHSMARDLSAREPRRGDIDVMLPSAGSDASPISTLQATTKVSAASLTADSGYDLDLDLDLTLPMASTAAPTFAASSAPTATAINSKQTDYDNAGPKSDFMSLNIDSRFQS